MAAQRADSKRAAAAASPGSANVVFVGNLPPSASKEEIEVFFSGCIDCGDVAAVAITGPGTASVAFDGPHAASAALGLDRCFFGEQRISVAASAADAAAGPDRGGGEGVGRPAVKVTGFNFFVDGGAETVIRILTEAFGGPAKVSSFYLAANEADSYAIISLVDQAALRDALAMHQRVCCGGVLCVKQIAWASRGGAEGQQGGGRRLAVKVEDFDLFLDGGEEAVVRTLREAFGGPAKVLSLDLVSNPEEWHAIICLADQAALRDALDMQS